MRLTINLDTKTIVLHGSYHFYQLQELYRDLPAAWKEFKFSHADDAPPLLIPQQPYPVTPYPVWPTGPNWPITYSGNDCQCK